MNGFSSRRTNLGLCLQIRESRIPGFVVMLMIPVFFFFFFFFCGLRCKQQRNQQPREKERTETVRREVQFVALRGDAPLRDHGDARIVPEDVDFGFPLTEGLRGGFDRAEV